MKKPELFQKNEVSKEVINRFNMIFEQIERERNKSPERIWVGDKTRKTAIASGLTAVASVFKRRKRK